MSRSSVQFLVSFTICMGTGIPAIALAFSSGQHRSMPAVACYVDPGNPGVAANAGLNNTNPTNGTFASCPYADDSLLPHLNAATVYVDTYSNAIGSPNGTAAEACTSPYNFSNGGDCATGFHYAQNTGWASIALTGADLAAWTNSAHQFDYAAIRIWLPPNTKAQGYVAY